VRAAAAIARVFPRIECETNAIAVAPGLARKYTNFFRRPHPAPLQCFAQDGFLECELCRIIRVLIGAAAADSEMTAHGPDALWRGGDDFFDFGRSVAALLLRDVYAHVFSGQRHRHKNGLALHARQKSAAVNRLFDVSPRGAGRLIGTGWARRRFHCWLM